MNFRNLTTTQKYLVKALSCLFVSASAHHCYIQKSFDKSNNYNGISLFNKAYADRDESDNDSTEKVFASFDAPEDRQVIINWSSTHSCTPDYMYYPKTANEVLSILLKHHSSNTKLRPIGNALSPNGIGMCDQSDLTGEESIPNKPKDAHKNMINVSQIDHIIVNASNRTVTVGAGASVAAVLKELKKFNLTLSNFSSVQEQQIAGWTQVAAHGTGCQFSTVDEMITEITLVSPTKGILRILPSSQGTKEVTTSVVQHFSLPRTVVSDELFNMVKVGLGSLGVVTELTLKCIPELKLEEKTFSLDREKIFSLDIEKKNHVNRLKDFRHVRYMWLPYTSSVIGVVSNPYNPKSPKTSVKSETTASATIDSNKPTKALCDLAKQLYFSGEHASAGAHPSMKTVEQLSFSQLRDLLLDYEPLDVENIKQVNVAEESYWKAISASEQLNTRIDDSNNILGFDCGGEQWVYEVCIPIGSFQDLKSAKVPRDIEFVQKVLAKLESENVPAPCPIEQRWTRGSSAYMSPAYSALSNTSSTKQLTEKDELFTWVGIIMYLPLSQTTEQRNMIAKKFKTYCELLDPLVKEYKGYPHWAKIELPEKSNEAKMDDLRRYLKQKYPVTEFNNYRKELDPHNVLSNSMIDQLFEDSHSIIPQSLSPKSDSRDL